MNTDGSVERKVAAFFSQYPSFQLKRGVVFIDPANEPSGIFYIEQGVAREYLISKNGNEITLNLYKSGSFLPMPWAIAHIPNAHFFEAMEDIQIRKAPKSDTMLFLKKQPDVVLDLLRRVFIGTDGLWGRIGSLTSDNSFVKLAATIYFLAKRFGISRNEDGEHITVTIQVGEKDIASYAGMSRETVSRELQKLKKQHIVTFEKKLLSINSCKRLEKILSM